MSGKLRSMTSVYLMKDDRFLLLFREGGRVVNHVYTGSAGGHFEKDELNDARACVLREMQEELGLTAEDIGEMAFRYVTLRDTNGEIRQNYYFFAELLCGRELVSNEGTLCWVTGEEALRLPMPVTAKAVFAHYLHTGRFDKKRYVGITGSDDTVFLELPET